MRIEIQIAALVLMSACAGAGDTAINSPTDNQGAPIPGQPTGEDKGEVAAAQLDSEYRLRTRFQLTAGALSPEPAYELLNQLHNEPGEAIVTMAEAAGVPAASALFDALPDSLSDKVAGWMSDAISEGGMADLQVLVAWSQLVLAQVDVESTLSIEDLDAEGHAVGAHTLQSLHFEIDGNEIEEDIPQISTLPGAGHSSVELWVERDSEGLHLTMGQQRFGLLFGEAAYQALQSAIEARYGTDIRGMIGNAIDCSTVATEVAAKCVLGVCVGHREELLGTCEGALDELSDRVHEQFGALDTELLRLAAGEALVMAGETGGSLLQSGLWDASAELGQGLRDLPARFSGASL